MVVETYIFHRTIQRDISREIEKSRKNDNSKKETGYERAIDKTRKIIKGVSKYYAERVLRSKNNMYNTE